MRSLSSITSKNVLWFLIGIIFLMISNTAFNTHCHTNKHGVIITHAHPYQKSNDDAPLTNHGHSDLEFILLDNLELLFFKLIAIYLLAGILIKKLYFKGLYRQILFDSPRSGKDRAPPVYHA